MTLRHLSPEKLHVVLRYIRRNKKMFVAIFRHDTTMTLVCTGPPPHTRFRNVDQWLILWLISLTPGFTRNKSPKSSSRVRNTAVMIHFVIVLCCSVCVFQCGAVYSSELQRVAVMMIFTQAYCCLRPCVAGCRSVLQYVAVCYVLQVLQHVACFVAVTRSVMQWAVAWCNVMQWATAWRSVVECVACGCVHMWR